MTEQINSADWQAKVLDSQQPVFVDFFATWCKPCMRELKAINELYPDWQDEYGVTVYVAFIDKA